MHILTGCIRPQGRVKQIQELMKGTNVRWAGNPLPLNPNTPDGKWIFGIDYSDCTTEEVFKFDTNWRRLETPIVEKHKKRHSLKKLIIFFKKKLI